MARTLCLWVMLGILLTACMPTYYTQYKYVMPESERGQMCVQKCKQSRNICKRYCTSSSQSVCESHERSKARRKYQLYVDAMTAKNKPIRLTAESFFDPSYCRYGNRETHECNCKSDYRACYKLCGGQIIAHQMCETNC